MGTIWLYWETRKGDSLVPPYIALCRKSVEVHAKHHDIRLVTPTNVREYLPDISSRVFEIEAEPLGRFDLYFNRGRRRWSAVAQRADFIRAFLLERYGGLYMDSDALLLADPEPFISLLTSTEFFAVRRSSHGKSHVSVSFYGSRPGGSIISEYANRLRERLAGSLYYSWNEIGAEMLTPITERHPGKFFAIAEHEVQAVTFEDAETMFHHVGLHLDKVAGPDTRVFMLYNGPFRHALKDIDLEKLYRSEMLVSQAFRAAIPEWAFREIRASGHRSVESAMWRNGTSGRV